MAGDPRRTQGEKKSPVTHNRDQNQWLRHEAVVYRDENSAFTPDQSQTGERLHGQQQRALYYGVPRGGTRQAEKTQLAP